MLAFSKGLASFTHGLFNEINRIPNVTFNLNTPVKVITNHSQEIVINDDERFDHIRSTINSNKLLEILGTSKPEFHLKYVDIYMVNIFTPRNDLKISGFGYLVPQAAENKEELLGCIFDSDIEKNSKFLYSKGNNPGPQQEYTKLTLMFGGHQWLGKQRPNDEEMLDRVHSVLQKHLGMSLQDTDVIDHTFIPQCIPQFEKEYVKQKEEFHKWLKSEYAGRITHGGMSYGDGCGVPDVVMNSFIDAHAACK
jgi:oxygen-dependent protoporphyrinogen oxidase